MVSLFTGIFLTLQLLSAKNDNYPKPRIIVEMIFPEHKRPSGNELLWSDAEYIANKPEWNKVLPIVSSGNTLKWYIHSASPIIFQNQGIVDSTIQNLLEPGDSVHIDFSNGSLKYSGKGSENLNLFRDLRSGLKEIKWPPMVPASNEMKFTIVDFNSWNVFFDTREDYIDRITDKYRSEISSYAYHYILSREYSFLEESRGSKFLSLIVKNLNGELSKERIKSIYDSTVGRREIKWLITSMAPGTEVHYLTTLSYIELFKEYDFPVLLERYAHNRPQLFNAVFGKAKQLYSGKLLESTLAYLITNRGIHEMKMDPEFDKILREYLSEQRDIKYKEYVKAYERREKSSSLRNGGYAPEIIAIDDQGKEFSTLESKGKPTVLFFWKSECKNCATVSDAIKQFQNEFGKDSLFSVICISGDIDKESWLKAIDEGHNTVNGATQLNAFYHKDNSTILKWYEVSDYPSVFILDDKGKFIQYPLADNIKETKKKLSEVFNRVVNVPFDGPYVMHEADSISAYSIDHSSVAVDRWKAGDEYNISISGKTTSRLSFPVTVRKRLLSPPPSEYPHVDKLLVLSDIEGEFQALKSLLLAGNVIDEEYNWKFGKGHLVFCGDMFDRGRQVTECLWLLYMLENKAKDAGGAVHFILGNHEIMNLTGDFRYVNNKYIQNSKRIGVSLLDLYGNRSEIGRWLRTKNVIEKIGDLLFVHGGISREMLSMNLTLSEVNLSARRQISAGNDATRIASALFDGQSSPYWFRGYYNRKTLTEKDALKLIDETLSRYKVSRIITGHTIVSDKITTHYEGKILNTDTKHAEGDSEALLIENKNFYRINSAGSKTILH